MANYTKTTDFEVKDNLPSGDPGKIIKGTEFEAEFDAISASIATKADQAGPIFTGTATFGDLNVTGSFTSLGIDDNGTTAAITIDATNDVAITNGLTVDGTTLVVDDTNNRVGIREAAPDRALVVRESVQQIARFGTTSGTRGYVTFSDQNTTNEDHQGVGVVGNDLKLWAGNFERVTIDGPTGNVGVGTDTPTNTLVVSDGNDGIELRTNLTDDNRIISYNRTTPSYTLLSFDAASYDFRLSGSSPSVTINSSGNVGIGTDDPSHALHVADATAKVRIESTNNTRPRLELYRPASVNNWQITNDGAVLTTEVGDDSTSFTERHRVTSGGNNYWNTDEMCLVAGNVGIGETAPQTSLHITQTTDASSDGIRLSRSNELASYTQWVEGSTFNIGYANPSTADPSSAALTINSSGYVGIGDSTPERQFVVSGTGAQRISIVSTDASGATLLLGDADNDAQGQIAYINSDDSMRFSTAGSSEMMRIDSSGRVGIGSDSPTAPLSILESDASTTIGGSGSVIKVRNPSGIIGSTSGLEFFHGNVETNVQRLCGIYGQYEQFDAAGFGGDLVFATQKSGASSVSERMRIDQDGNVGIGTGSPQTSLHITQTNDASSDGIRVSRSSGAATYTQWVDTAARYNIGYSNPQTNDPTTALLTLGGVNDYVGINEEAPDERLEVAGDIKSAVGGNAGVYHFGATSDQTKIVGRDTSHPTLPDTMEFATGGSTRLTIDSSGDLTIGASSDSFGHSISLTSTNGDLNFVSAGAGNDALIQANDGANGPLRLSNQASTFATSLSIYEDRIHLGTNSHPGWFKGSGTPESVVTAPVGSLYSRTDGGAGTTLYVKESGTGNTGWVAK